MTILDTETLAQPREVILKNLPTWSEEEAKTRVPANYKKPETISAWLESDRESHGSDVLEKAALTPEHSTIAIVGFWKEGRVEQLVASSVSAEMKRQEGSVTTWMPSEAELIEHAFMRLNEGGGPVFKKGVRGWTAGQQDPVLGWNIPFDIKMLVRRAWILGVHVPLSVFNPLSRYPVPERYICMMDRFRAGSFKDPYTSLNNALCSVGLPEKGDGKEFGKLWQEDRAAALAYSANELRLQADLYRRMGVDL